MKNSHLIIAFALALGACKSEIKKEGITNDASKSEIQEVNVYTHRHYEVDQMLFAKFEAQTGIKVNVVNAKADELMQKMTLEGKQSPADVLITVDAGRLVRAKDKGLLQAIDSKLLTTIIPSNLRDEENQWFALTKRARVIVYDKDKTNPEQLSTYEDLTAPKWSEKILVRSSGNIYNQSLMASIIAHKGEDAAKTWGENIVKNMARSPQGNDRDQIKAVIAGEGDLAIVNTYYIGKLLNSEDPEEVKVGLRIGVFFPNQDDRGTHINISGAGVAKYAPNKANAIKFIEYLVNEDAQKVFASSNYEYPVNPAVEVSDLLKSWGIFKEDTLPLSKLGENNKKAVLVFDETGWK
jgi:iron(III) transport system substrate-binding protein